VLEGNILSDDNHSLQVNENRQMVFAEHVIFPRPLYCSFEVTCTNERADAL